MMPRKQIPEPRASFLRDVDANLKEEAELHCFGGFVVTRKELRPLLGNPEREDLTLRLWIEAIEEERG